MDADEMVANLLEELADKDMLSGQLQELSDGAHTSAKDQPVLAAPGAPSPSLPMQQPVSTVPNSSGTWATSAELQAPGVVAAAGTDSWVSGAAAGPYASPDQPGPSAAAAGSGSGAAGVNGSSGDTGNSGDVGNDAQPLFSVQLLRQNRDAIASATVQELWVMAHDYMLGPLQQPKKSADAAKRSRSGASRRRVTEQQKLEMLEAELAKKMQELELLQRQRNWLSMREEVLKDLMQVNQQTGPSQQQLLPKTQEQQQHLSGRGPARPDEGWPGAGALSGPLGPGGLVAERVSSSSASAGAAAAPAGDPGASPGPLERAAAPVWEGCSSAAPGQSSFSLWPSQLPCKAEGSGAAGSGAAPAAAAAAAAGAVQLQQHQDQQLQKAGSMGSSRGQKAMDATARLVQEALAKLQVDAQLQLKYKSMTVDQYLENTRGWVREYALFLQFCDADPATMARLEEAVEAHRLQEAALLVMGVDTVFAAQYRHMETGQQHSVPLSHWARALDRMTPPLSPAMERSQFQGMLLYQTTMKALDDERQSILKEHHDLSSAGAAEALQEQLAALLRRFESVNMVHNLYAVYSLQPVQWASLFVGSYPFVPSVYVELWGEALRRYLLRIADG